MPSNTDYVTIFQHANYGGVAKQLPAGNYDMNDLGIGNDQLSSLLVPPGLKVTLFEHAGFQGRTKEITADNAFISDFNDFTSSIKVERVVTIFKDANYTGASQYLVEGSYDMN